jgi:NAD-dependent dihydropyrimidine dehydrogenase PreA subunit
MVEETGKEEQVIIIDRERCIGCGECIDICPQSRDTEYPVYEREDDGSPRVVNADSCIRCLSCEINCRASAVRINIARLRMPTTYIVDERAKSKREAMF